MQNQNTTQTWTISAVPSHMLVQLLRGTVFQRLIQIAAWEEACINPVVLLMRLLDLMLTRETKNPCSVEPKEYARMVIKNELLPRVTSQWYVNYHRYILFYSWGNTFSRLFNDVHSRV